MAEITNKTIITKKEGLLSSEMDEGLAMMSIENSSYYGMDKIGRSIWETFDAPTSVEMICTKLCERFDVSAEACQKDVIDYMGKLQQVGLITIA